MILEMDIVGSRSLPRVGRLRRWLMIVPLFVGLCTLAAQVTADDAKPMGSTTLVALEESVQSLFSLPSLDGPTHELARLRGRIVLVHFFATWCEPCRAEMASLRQCSPGSTAGRSQSCPSAWPRPMAPYAGSSRATYCPLRSCSIATVRSRGRGISIHCPPRSCWII